MPRSGKEVRERLQQAALELYRERGFDQTTSAEIAARAGVTERTFFRHFPDKREVLFDGEAPLRDRLVGAIAAAPAGLSPLETALAAFASIEQLLLDNRSLAEARHGVIASTPALYERALAKTALLTDAMAAALAERGVEPRLAALAAKSGMAAFGHATAAWAEAPGSRLPTHLEAAFQALHGLTTRP